MKFPSLGLTGVVVLLITGCLGAGDGGAGATGPTADPSGSTRYGTATLQALYSCVPTKANYPDPHALAACRELLHRYPVQPNPLAGGSP